MTIEYNEFRSLDSPVVHRTVVGVKPEPVSVTVVWSDAVGFGEGHSSPAFREYVAKKLWVAGADLRHGTVHIEPGITTPDQFVATWYP